MCSWELSRRSLVTEGNANNYWRDHETSSNSGVGPFVAAGPIMAALSGAVIGAATGGVTGGLIGLGMPEYEAKQYEGKLRDGNILLSVHTENGDQAKQAEEIFKAGGAKDITRSGEEAVRK
ncbi:hypothetical protein KBI23_13590 [bacterium]|nr:hypothetical protein [bacterium]MBP9808531.1 hypothetical protein [bacterium]